MENNTEELTNKAKEQKEEHLKKLTEEYLEEEQSAAFLGVIDSDKLLISSDCRDKIAPCPKLRSGKVSHLSFYILSYPYRTLSFQESDNLRYRILRRYRNQHVNVVGHQMPLLYHALLTFCQIVKHRS